MSLMMFKCNFSSPKVQRLKGNSGNMPLPRTVQIQADLRTEGCAHYTDLSGVMSVRHTNRSDFWCHLVSCPWAPGSKTIANSVKQKKNYIKQYLKTWSAITRARVMLLLMLCFNVSIIVFIVLYNIFEQTRCFPMEERLDNMFSEKKQAKKEVAEKKEGAEKNEAADKVAEPAPGTASASAPGETQDLQNLLKAWGAKD